MRIVFPTRGAPTRRRSIDPSVESRRERLLRSPQRVVGPVGPGLFGAGPSSGAADPVQLQHVVRRADQRPLPADLLEAAQEELPEPAHPCLICPSTGSRNDANTHRMDRRTQLDVCGTGGLTRSWCSRRVTCTAPLARVLRACRQSDAPWKIPHLNREKSAGPAVSHA
jgi:hypothetical protein